MQSVEHRGNLRQMPIAMTRDTNQQMGVFFHLRLYSAVRFHTMNRHFKSDRYFKIARKRIMQPSRTLIALACLLHLQLAQADVLPEAKVELKIPLTKKPTTRPMTVAYVPYLSRYYIADGGLAPMPGEMEIALSKSQVHAFDAKGNYLESGKPGLDNRSIYFNPNTHKLESVTYNVSSDAGFSPNTGVFAIELTETGDIKDFPTEIAAFNPAFGSASTMPTYDAGNNRYLAKQERSNKVFIVELGKRERVGEITLDFAAAGVVHDDLSEHFIAYTGIPGEELALLDVDHKAVLVFNLDGKLVGKSALPATIKLRAQNHYNGLGYTNGMMFVYHEKDGEFGTYYGVRISDKAQIN